MSPLRFILLLVLALAIPVKGVLAAGMMGCGSMSGQAMMGHGSSGDPHHAVAPLAMSSAADAHHDDAHHDEAHHGDARQGDAPHGDAQPLESDAPAAGHHGSKCSSCAPCSVAVAPPCDALSLPSVPPVTQRLTGHFEPGPAVNLDVLLRPPR